MGHEAFDGLYDGHPLRSTCTDCTIWDQVPPDAMISSVTVTSLRYQRQTVMLDWGIHAGADARIRTPDLNIAPVAKDLETNVTTMDHAKEMLIGNIRSCAGRTTNALGQAACGAGLYCAMRTSDIEPKPDTQTNSLAQLGSPNNRPRTPKTIPTRARVARESRRRKKISKRD